MFHYRNRTLCTQRFRTRLDEERLETFEFRLQFSGSVHGVIGLLIDNNTDRVMDNTSVRVYDNASASGNG